MAFCSEHKFSLSVVKIQRGIINPPRIGSLDEFIPYYGDDGSLDHMWNL